VLVLLIALVLFGIQACGSSPSKGTPNSQTPSAEQTTSGNNSSTTQSGSTEAAQTSANDDSVQEAIEPDQPPTIVESCKDEAYNKYEHQSRESIRKGLAATKAQKYGVGFRDIEEHNKWSKTFTSLFKSVNDACTSLVNCAKKHPKDKKTACVEEAKTFRSWESLTKQFAEKIKTAETTQPPKLCSQPPSLGDEDRCFHRLGKNIEKVCDTEDCKDAGACWEEIGYLGTAIKQAQQACSFVHQDLNNCRSYVEETQRRKDKFAQCQELQGKLAITIFPAL